MNISDNFNRASLGSNWTIGTSPGTPYISGNQLVTNNSAKLWWSANTFNNDQWVSAKQYGSGWRGVTCRVSGSGTAIYAYVAWLADSNGSVSLRLGWHNGGTGFGQYLDTSSQIPMTLGDTLKLEVTGQSPNILLTCYLNNVVVKTLAQASFSNPAAILSSGTTGLYFSAATAIFDDFQAGPVANTINLLSGKLKFRGKI